jgi:hypothetical protein
MLHHRNKLVRACETTGVALLGRTLYRQRLRLSLRGG